MMTKILTENIFVGAIATCFCGCRFQVEAGDEIVRVWPMAYGRVICPKCGKRCEVWPKRQTED